MTNEELIKQRVLVVQQLETPYFHIDLIMKKIMHFSDADILNNKIRHNRELKREVRRKKLERIFKNKKE